MKNVVFEKNGELIDYQHLMGKININFLPRMDYKWIKVDGTFLVFAVTVNETQAGRHTK